MRMRDNHFFRGKIKNPKQKEETLSKDEKIIIVVLCIFIAALFILTVYAVAFTVSRLKFLI